jgi:hypothetical protein
MESDKSIGGASDGTSRAADDASRLKTSWDMAADIIRTFDDDVQ